MNRDEMLNRLRTATEPWDILIIGGGATGLGTAVDAATRGYRTALVEKFDFGKGTSSRSTKLIHGGVRYLQQGNVALVMESLRERGRLLRNAPHLVSDLKFIVPSYQWWESPFYGIGMKVYDMLAGRYGFGRSRMLSRKEVIAAIPNIEQEGLQGGTLYYDGQFDDARLAICLAQTAADPHNVVGPDEEGAPEDKGMRGAALVNYCGVVGFEKDADGFITGAEVEDAETGDRFTVRARVVINATGPFADNLRRLDRPEARPVIVPSQGVHIVLDKSFLPGEAAIMVPHTPDGRVMFAIPWHDVALIGTTDTPVDEVLPEPVPLREEVEFILETANHYLARDAGPNDILSVFAGIRPLVNPGGADEGDTAGISRDHSILIEPTSGLMTVAGGKWTTYRNMAEDVVDKAMLLGDLEPRECVTKHFGLHGYHESSEQFGRFDYYGDDAPAIMDFLEEPGMSEKVHERLDLTVGEVIWFCRHEMARTVEDVLARRSRSLLFDAQAALEAAPRVAEILVTELGSEKIDSQMNRFAGLAQRYVVK